MVKHSYPMRINVYIAKNHSTTRREADELVKNGRVMINGERAILGDKVSARDTVKVEIPRKQYHYYAYNKPKGIVTHSPQKGEKDIASSVPLKGVFPLGRLDKDSHGLIILTDDGRITERLLSPGGDHEKHYRVTTAYKLRPGFREAVEKGVDIGGYVTKPCKVHILGDMRFSITLTEGKRHQIKRMCVALKSDVIDLERTQILNIKIGSLPRGAYRPIEGVELKEFLQALGL